MMTYCKTPRPRRAAIHATCALLLLVAACGGEPPTDQGEREASWLWNAKKAWQSFEAGERVQPTQAALDAWTCINVRQEHKVVGGTMFRDGMWVPTGQGHNIIACLGRDKDKTPHVVEIVDGQPTEANGYTWYRVRFTSFNYATGRYEDNREGWVATGTSYAYMEAAPAGAHLTTAADLGYVPTTPPPWKTFATNALVQPTTPALDAWTCLNVRSSWEIEGTSMFADGMWLSSGHNIIACLGRDKHNRPHVMQVVLGPLEDSGYTWYKVKFNSYNYVTGAVESGREGWIAAGAGNSAYLEYASAGMTSADDAPTPASWTPPKPDTWTSFPARATVTDQVASYKCHNVRTSTEKWGLTMFWTDSRFCEGHNIVACLKPGSQLDILGKADKVGGVQWWFVGFNNSKGEYVAGFSAEWGASADYPFLQDAPQFNGTPLPKVSGKEAASTTIWATEPGKDAPGSHPTCTKLAP